MGCFLLFNCQKEAGEVISRKILHTDEDNQYSYLNKILNQRNGQQKLEDAYEYLQQLKADIANAIPTLEKSIIETVHDGGGRNSPLIDTRKSAKMRDGSMEQTIFRMSLNLNATDQKQLIKNAKLADNIILLIPKINSAIQNTSDVLKSIINKDNNHSRNLRL